MRSVLKILGLTAIYFLIASFGLKFATFHDNVSPVWPATGFSLFVLHRFGWRVWPAIALGAWLTNAMTPLPWPGVFVIGIGNTLEAICGAYLIRSFFLQKERFGDLTTPVAFALGSFVGSLVSASLGLFALAAFGNLAPSAWSPVWLTWWTGDFLGGLLFAPVLISVPLTKFEWKPAAIYLAAFALFSAVSGFVFFSGYGTPFIFLMFPVLLFTALRLGRYEVYIASLLIGVVSLFATSRGLGPFAAGMPSEQIAHLQIFLISVGLTGLTLASLKKHLFSRVVLGTLIASWFISGLVFYYFERTSQIQESARFEASTEQIQHALLARLDSYGQTLRAGVALYKANPEINAKTWRTYFGALELTKSFPGIKGQGVIWPVAKNEMADFEHERRLEGLSAFRVHGVPDSSPELKSADVGYVIKYVEPLENNVTALGLDMGSERHRREAADLARDTNTETMTSPVRLVRDEGTVQGFVMLFPLYKVGAPLNSVDQRRLAHLGWIYSAISAPQLFESLMPNMNGKIELKVSDIAAASGDEVLYLSFSHTHQVADHESLISVGQRSYRIGWHRGPSYVYSHETVIAWVGLCGAIISLFFAYLVMSLQIVSRRSHEIAQDLTSELRTTMGRLEYIAKTAPVTVSHWSDDYRLLFGNDSFFKWFDEDPSELLGRTLEQIFNREVYESHLPHVAVAMSGRTTNFERESHSHIDGEMRNVVLTYVPDIHDGIVKGFFLFAQNVTDLKRAELIAVQERQVAMEASKVKTQFLANMSHELRTPINGIVGMAEVIGATSLTADLKDHLSTLTRSADSLLTIVNDILDISKVEVGKLEIESIEFSLKKLFAELGSSFEPQFADKKIKLEIIADVPENLSYLGDPSRLRQILNNLVGNALKFTSSGSVKIECIRLAQGADTSEFEIRVIDSGVGISPEALPRLFQSFSQADSSTSRRFGGTGLGLAISKTLVELMGGTLGVKSVESEGSAFWFRLKFANVILANGVLANGVPEVRNLKVEIAVSNDRGASASDAADKRGTVLVVEDNLINQKVMTLTLRNLGFDFMIANNGQEAIEMVSRHSFDLVLMDCQMPIIDGYEATRTIRAHERIEIAQLPIIAVTANAIAGDQEKCLEAGMDDYMSKPIKTAQLKLLLEKWARKSAHRAS